jgi:hypothetical protein
MAQVVEVAKDVGARGARRDAPVEGMTGGAAQPVQGPAFVRAKKFHFRSLGGCGTVAIAGHQSSAIGAAAELS